jgi:hypothetical protein
LYRLSEVDVSVEDINMLTGISTAEVSLVKRGANKKRIAFRKSENQMAIDQSVMEAVLGAPADGEAKFVELMKSKGVDGDKLVAAVANYRIQKGCEDLLSGEDMHQVMKSAGLASPDVAPVEKSQELSEQVEINKSILDRLAKSEGLNKSLVDQLTSITEASAEKEMVQLAKSFTHLSQDESKTVELLKGAKSVSEDYFGQVVDMLKGQSEVNKSSGLLKTVGGLNQGSPDSAQGKLEQIAKAYQSDGMTKEKAIVKALEENPELYAQDLNDHPAQRGVATYVR